MNIDVIHNALAESLAGKRTFPQVVAALLAEGVESYHTDLARMEETFYCKNGETHVEKMAFPLQQIAESFSSEQVIAAVRAAQADQVRYPEFLRLILAAGVMGYGAFLTGKRVVYFGRTGEMHIEEFPRPK